MKGTFAVSGKNREILIEDEYLKVGPGVYLNSECDGSCDLCMEYAENTVGCIGDLNAKALDYLEVEVLEDKGDIVKVSVEVDCGEYNIGFTFEVYKEFIEIKGTNR